MGSFVMPDLCTMRVSTCATLGGKARHQAKGENEGTKSTSKADKKPLEGEGRKPDEDENQLKGSILY